MNEEIICNICQQRGEMFEYCPVMRAKKRRRTTYGKCLNGCIHAKVEIVKMNKPLWASSMQTHQVTTIQILCKKTLKYVTTLKKDCDKFNNRTITGFFQ